MCHKQFSWCFSWSFFDLRFSCCLNWFERREYLPSFQFCFYWSFSWIILSRSKWSLFRSVLPTQPFRSSASPGFVQISDQWRIQQWFAMRASQTFSVKHFSATINLMLILQQRMQAFETFLLNHNSSYQVIYGPSLSLIENKNSFMHKKVNIEQRRLLRHSSCPMTIAIVIANTFTNTRESRQLHNSGRVA